MGYIQEKKKKEALFRIKINFILVFTLKFNFRIVKKQNKFITDLLRVISKHMGIIYILKAVVFMTWRAYMKHWDLICFL